MLQETIQHYYNRPQSLAPKFHQVSAINKICQEREIRNYKVGEEESQVNGKTPSAIDTFPALNVCFKNMSWVYLQNRLAFVHLWI